MIESIGVHVIWLMVATTVSIVGAASLAYSALGSQVRSELGITSPRDVLRIVSARLFQNGKLASVIATGDLTDLLYTIDCLKWGYLDFDSRMQREVEFLAEHHSDWRVRYTCLSALVKRRRRPLRRKLKKMIAREVSKCSDLLARSKMLEPLSSLLATGD